MSDPAPLRAATRSRTLSRRFGLVIVGIVAGLGIAELGARVAGPLAGEDLFYGAMTAPPKGMFRWSPTLGNEPTPGFSGVRESLDGAIPIRFDSLGLRGAGRVPDRETWLAIGDSFVLGAQVREEDTFTERLGEAMGVQVLNAGCDAYSTLHATLRYAELDPQVDARTVVAVYYLGNDLHDNHHARETIASSTRTRPPEDPPELLSPWLRFLHRHSYLAAYVQVANGRRKQLAGTSEGMYDVRDEMALWSYKGKPRLDELMRATRETLEQLRDATESRGDRLLVAVAPPAFYVDEEMLAQLLGDFDLPTVGTDHPRTAVLDALTTLGIESCDLTPGLRAAHAEGVRTYLRFDGHWNAAGHRVVAEEIARCLRREDHVAAPGPTTDAIAASDAPLPPLAPPLPDAGRPPLPGPPLPDGATGPRGPPLGKRPRHEATRPGGAAADRPSP